jgi:hypothetical protein
MIGLVMKSEQSNGTSIQSPYLWRNLKMNTFAVTNSAVSKAVTDAKPEMVKQQRDTKSEAASVHTDAASKVPQISSSGVDIVA